MEQQRIVLAGATGNVGGRVAHEFVRLFTPKTDSPLPVWQGMQYLYCMFEGNGMLKPLDNQRYPNLQWAGVRTVLNQAV